MSAKTDRNVAYAAQRRSSGAIRISVPDSLPGSSGVVEQTMVDAELPSVGNRVETDPATEVTLLMNARRATLFVSCRNKGGVVATLGQALATSGVHIIDSEQHMGAEMSHVFQRIHIDVSGLPAGAPDFVGALKKVTSALGLSFSVHETARRKRVGIFVSKYDHCLFDLLLRHRAGELECDIPLIISNHPDLKPVADQFGVPYKVVPKSAANKPEAERVEGSMLEDQGVDLIVLARYMQVLSKDFTASWERRIINIHHSFLPAFIGGQPYHQAHRRGVKLIGATAHYATSTLDEGPIIEQDVTRCTHKDTIEDLTRKGRDLEKTVLARAVRWHLEDRVLVFSNKTIVFV